jgi:hypothetical protein
MNFALIVIANHATQIFIFPRLHFKNHTVTDMLLQLQLQVQNQQVFQINVFFYYHFKHFTTCEGLVRNTQFLLFYTLMSQAY